MKILILLLALTGCTSVQVTPDGCEVKTVRRVAITCEDATVVAGQVLINDETVRVLVKEAAPILKDN